MATGSKAAAAPSLQPHFEAIDENFSPEAKAGCHLSIMAAPGLLSCSVLNIQANKFLAFQQYKAESDSSFETACRLVKQQNSTLLTGEYRTVTAAVAHSLFTLVPAPLFETGKAEELLRFNHGNPLGKVSHDHIRANDAVNIYALPQNIGQALVNAFPNVQLMHFSTPLLEGLIALNKQAKNPQVFASLMPEHFFVTALEGDRLLLHNCFPQKTKEDVAYYILFAVEQLKLNPDDVPLILMGEAQQGDGLFQLLEKYVRHVRLAERPRTFSYSLKLSDVPGHHCFPLFTHPFAL